MITFAMLARQLILPRPLPTLLTPLLLYCCKLFVAAEKVKPFAIKQIQTLLPKTPGVGVPPHSNFDLAPSSSVSWRPCVFITLRIAFSANPLYSQPSELPGGVGYTRPQNGLVLTYSFSCVNRGWGEMPLRG